MIPRNQKYSLYASDRSFLNGYSIENKWPIFFWKFFLGINNNFLDLFIYTKIKYIYDPIDRFRLQIDQYFASQLKNFVPHSIDKSY